MAISEIIENGYVSIILFVVSFIILSIIIYVFVEFIFFNKKLNHLAPLVDTEYNLINSEETIESILTNQTSQDTIVTISNDTKYQLMLFLKSALTALHNNADKFTQLTFYTQPIEKLIANNPWYITVLKFSKFCFIVPTVTIEVIDGITEELYGSLSSSELFITKNGIEYYLPLEFDHAMQIYVKNKQYLDPLIPVF